LMICRKQVRYIEQQMVDNNYLRDQLCLPLDDI